MRLPLLSCLLTACVAIAPPCWSATAVSLPGTEPLELTGDIASNLVAGVDRFLLRKLDESVSQREKFWHRDFTSPSGYEGSIQTNRHRLASILGVRDARLPRVELEVLANPEPTVTSPFAFRILRVRWSVLEGVYGEGLLLQIPDPNSVYMNPAMASRYGLRPPPGNAATTARALRVSIIAVPDADQTPEQLCGLTPGVPPESQFARRLAEKGYRVLVPCLVSRESGIPRGPDANRGAFLSNREFLYRPAFELGRHLIGYEVQKILAAVDWLKRTEGSGDGSPDTAAGTPVGIVGWGEGGLLALHAGALDPRLEVVGVSGYFERRENVWQEPIERNVFGLLERFGDAELAAMIAPRALLIEAARGPELTVAGGRGAAPGRLTTPKLADVRSEFARAESLLQGFTNRAPFELIVSGEGLGFYGSLELTDRLMKRLPLDRVRPAAGRPLPGDHPFTAEHATERQRRSVAEIEWHTQRLLADSAQARQKFMSRLDTSSVVAYERTAAAYREVFERDVIGRFDDPLLPLHARTRKAYETESWTGYEVVLDVWPEVIAYGVLLVPKNLKEGERRPVVVCQHGLEGRPQDIIQGNHPAYHDFAARLAERGFITFAPQNLYLFEDRFRTLQRKANPIGKTLFSIIVPQLRQIMAWLKTLGFVDPERIAFYGLSYGGKTAMRVPAVIPDYCLSICSADFNEWVWKNASTRSPYSYVWTGEYEIFEFDLGSTFGYAEMAALIAPRPFMVERGHFDGVAPDETVAYEFAKVRHLYAARLKLPDRCEIEWFDGPHTIHGKGTFDFLHRHLRWPSAP